jgi:hypothetical protein
MTGDGGLSRLVAKATFISKTTTLSEISLLFQDINKAIRRLPRPKARAALRSMEVYYMMPIVSSNREDGFDYLAQSLDKNVYIGDREDLASSFRGLVPLLAFPSEEISEMSDLLSLLNVTWPRLSSIIVSDLKPQGRISVHSGYTNYLRERSPFIES